MRNKIINYFFDSEEAYGEVGKLFELAIFLAPISIILTILIRVLL